MKKYTSTKSYLIESTYGINELNLTGVYKMYHSDYKDIFYIGSTGGISKNSNSSGFCLRFRSHIHSFRNNTHFCKELMFKIKPLAGVPDRVFAYKEGTNSPIGSFKDYDTGTVYTSVKHPKGLIDLIGMRCVPVDKERIHDFLKLVSNHKIPNTTFKVQFTKHNLTEAGFKEFLALVYPKKNTESKKSRRYYLHGKIKKCNCVKMGATDKTIFVTDHELPNVDDKIKKFIFELRDKHGYSIQQEIPD